MASQLPVSDIQRTWAVGCWRALQAFKRRDEFCYIYGAKGVLIKDRATFEKLWSAEPNYFKKYTSKQKEEIFKNSVGKTAYDCSGFVGWYVYPWIKTYSSNMWNRRVVETGFADGLAGQLLYTTFNGTGRHIGVDVGNGWCMDMGVESTDDNVKAGLDSIRMRRLSEVNYWEHSFQIRTVDYTGSTAKKV